MRTTTLLFHEGAPTAGAVDSPPMPALAAFRLMPPVTEPEPVFPDFPLAVPGMIALPPEPHVPADGRQMVQSAH